MFVDEFERKKKKYFISFEIIYQPVATSFLSILLYFTILYFLYFLLPTIFVYVERKSDIKHINKFVLYCQGKCIYLVQFRVLDGGSFLEMGEIENFIELFKCFMRIMKFIRLGIDRVTDLLEFKIEVRVFHPKSVNSI